MSSTDSKITKLQTHFQALSSIAPELNAASDQLTQTVGTLDETLKTLNIGLPAWVTFRSRAVEGWEYDSDQIGYDKIDGKWGMALRRIWGNERTEEHGVIGPFLFNDAPRDLRLVGVDYLPELVEALGKTALETTKRLQEKTKQISDLIEVIKPVRSVWDKLLDQVKTKVSASTYKSWFATTRLNRTEGDTIYIQIPNVMFRQVLTRTYGEIIRAALLELGMPNLKLQYVSTEEEKAALQARKGSK